MSSTYAPTHRASTHRAVTHHGRAAVVAAILAAILAAVVVTLAPGAHAYRVEAPTRDTGADRVTYVESDVYPRRFYVETGDGAAYLVRGCRTRRDARPCVHDGRASGRGSWARVTRGGDRLPIGRRMMRRAYLAR